MGNRVRRKWQWKEVAGMDNPQCAKSHTQSRRQTVLRGRRPGYPFSPQCASSYRGMLSEECAFAVFQPLGQLAFDIHKDRIQRQGQNVEDQYLDPGPAVTRQLRGCDLL